MVIKSMKKAGTKKGGARKGAVKGSRLAYDDTEQEDLSNKGKVKKKVQTGTAKKKGGASAWITHVKAYAKKNKVSYKVAMSKAKATYKKAKK
tara:strand:- start:362 stop:637 length:276 start_codon:yes stop_codon:yes gene_type:complete